MNELVLASQWLKGRRTLPRYLILGMTNLCNSKCVTCFYWDHLNVNRHLEMSFNPWNFDADDDWYDPAKFYVRASNGHDHSEKLQVPFLPSQYTEMARVVGAGVIPAYTSMQALVRDAIFHRLMWLAENFELAGVKESLALEAMLVEQDNAAVELGNLEKAITNARGLFNTMLASGDDMGLSRMLVSHEFQADKMQTLLWSAKKAPTYGLDFWPVLDSWAVMGLDV